MGYATQQDANDFGLIPSALGIDVTPAQIQRALDTRSAYADSKLRARYGYENVPLAQPYDPSLVQAVVHLATFDLLSRRGFDAQNPTDVAVKLRFDEAVKFLDGIERQTVSIAVAVAGGSIQNPTAAAAPIAAPLVISQPLQGWMPGQRSGFPGAPPPPGIAGAGTGTYGGGGAGTWWPGCGWDPPGTV